MSDGFVIAAKAELYTCKTVFKTSDLQIHKIETLNSHTGCIKITKFCYRTYFYDKFWRKAIQLGNFCKFQPKLPNLKASNEMDPSLENFGLKAHPYGWHALVPSTCYVPSPFRPTIKVNEFEKLYHQDHCM